MTNEKDLLLQQGETMKSKPPLNPIIGLSEIKASVNLNKFYISLEGIFYKSIE